MNWIESELRKPENERQVLGWHAATKSIRFVRHVAGRWIDSLMGEQFSSQDLTHWCEIQGPKKGGIASHEKSKDVHSDSAIADV